MTDQAPKGPAEQVPPQGYAPPEQPPAQAGEQVQPTAPAPTPGPTQGDFDQFFNTRVRAYTDQAVARATDPLKAQLAEYEKRLGIQPPAQQPEEQLPPQQPPQAPPGQPPPVQQPPAQALPPGVPPAPTGPDFDPYYAQIDEIVLALGIPGDAQEIKNIEDKSKSLYGTALVDYAREQVKAYTVRTAGEPPEEPASPNARLGVGIGDGGPVEQNPIANIVDPDELWELHLEKEAKNQG